MDRPNVLLLTLDTLRWDRLSAYGAKRHLTPTLDRLASTGIRFDQAITGGSWTQAAFPVILTSSSAGKYGGCLSHLSSERPSAVEQLSNSGYETAAFSTNPHLSKLTSYDRGFDSFSDLAPFDREPPLARIKAGQPLLRRAWTHRILGWIGGHSRPVRVYSEGSEVTDRVCEWVSSASTPFFLWAHYMDVHWPYHLEADLSGPKELAQVWRDLSIMHRRANSRDGRGLTGAQCERFEGLYERALHYLDSEICRLLTFVESSKLGRNTIVIVLSDHGEEFLDHGRWGHWESNLYDEIIRVPLLITLPNTPPATVARQVSLIDIMPTVLDLCQCSPPEAMEGHSLVPLWSNQTGCYPSSHAICEMRRDPWHRVAVRTQTFKYIWDNQTPDDPLLFDLVTDPAEQVDVSGMQPEVMERFRTILDAHLGEVAETEPTTRPPQVEKDETLTKRLRALGYLD